MTGSIINNSGNQLFLPKTLSMRYCREFLDANELCKYKKNCNFVHKLFPTQFPENDIKIIKDYVQQAEGLTFHNSVKFTVYQATRMHHFVFQEELLVVFLVLVVSLQLLDSMI